MCGFVSQGNSEAEALSKAIICSPNAKSGLTCDFFFLQAVRTSSKLGNTNHLYERSAISVVHTHRRVGPK